MQCHIHHETCDSPPRLSWEVGLSCALLWGAISFSELLFLPLGCLFSKLFFYHGPDNLLAQFTEIPFCQLQQSCPGKTQTKESERTFVHFWCNLSSPSRANIMSACSGPCNMCSWVLSISKNGDSLDPPLWVSCFLFQSLTALIVKKCFLYIHNNLE